MHISCLEKHNLVRSRRAIKKKPLDDLGVERRARKIPEKLKETKERVRSLGREKTILEKASGAEAQFNKQTVRTTERDSSESFVEKETAKKLNRKRKGARTPIGSGESMGQRTRVNNNERNRRSEGEKGRSRVESLLKFSSIHKRTVTYYELRQQVRVVSGEGGERDSTPIWPEKKTHSEKDSSVGVGLQREGLLGQKSKGTKVSSRKKR